MNVSGRRIRNLSAVMMALAFLLLMSMPARAEEIFPLPFEDFVQRAAFADANWEADGTELIRMLSPEEGVTVSVCLKGENIAAITAEYPIGQPTDSVRNALEALAWLDAQTIENAFSQTSEEMIEADGFIVCRVEGELREAVSICRAEDAEQMVWQPIHGGARIHNKPRCSGMDAARMITEEAAADTGWQNCGKCRKNP